MSSNEVYNISSKKFLKKQKAKETKKTYNKEQDRTHLLSQLKFEDRVFKLTEDELFMHAEMDYIRFRLLMRSIPKNNDEKRNTEESMSSFSSRLRVILMEIKRRSDLQNDGNQVARAFLLRFEKKEVNDRFEQVGIKISVEEIAGIKIT